MLRVVVVSLGLVSVAAAQGPGGAVTRQDAVDAVQEASDLRGDWAEWISDLADEIGGMPPGPDKDAMEDALADLVAEWAGADIAAGAAIDDALDLIAEGDAATDPAVRDGKYSDAINRAGDAIADLDFLLGGPLTAFDDAADAVGWSSIASTVMFRSPPPVVGALS